MADMKLPPFLDLVGESLVFNRENETLVYMVPEVFFNSNSKNAIAEIKGQYVSMIGLCDYYIIDKKGVKSKIKPFNFPTMFLCKPSSIEKAKNVVIEDLNDNDEDEEEEKFVKDAADRISKDYRLLKFNKGDEVVSQVRVPQIIDNVELFYKLSLITAKIPGNIPYNEGWKLFLENMELNGNKYGLNAQLFGVVWAGFCRDKKDISKPFRHSNSKDMYGYKAVSIKLLPNYISPYTAMLSEGWTEAIASAIMLSDKPEDEIAHSPLEKIVMQ